MDDQPAVTTLLFTDIEGSTRLWEDVPERMQAALARHDAIAREAVESNRGTVVKMTGDGVYATFGDPRDAIEAAVALQRSLADAAATADVPLRVRCGLHAGVVEARDRDYFGAAVNRAARIMGAAHGGQILVSEAVAARVGKRLPPDIALIDLGVVRLRDLSSPEHVRQIVHPELRRDFPPLRSLEATPNNLPQQVTSFVGRERELGEARALLAGARLLTLVGVGGLGKTRLSLQLAAAVLDDYPDGVWLVELAPVTDGGHVPQAVASVLGVKEEAGRPVQEALVRHVADRRLLLILDNCEHLLQACAELAMALLRAGPHARILASSREPLRVRGEVTYPLPSLAVPADRRMLGPESLADFEAVRLFADRAAAAKPAFRITVQNAAAIADICLHLDGIPLAIELAAARVRALAVEQIAERLDHRLRLLTGGDRTALPRQQTLRACIDWSHDLLAEPERALFRRLAVFAGGWTIDAAEAVGVGGSVAPRDVLDLLTHLVDRSLVALDARGDRYSLLETIREYAGEQLEASGEQEATRARHLDYYLALAEKARPELVGPKQGEWLARLDLERENLLSAHAGCEHVAEGAGADLRLASALRRYWMTRGYLGLGFRVTVEALDRAGARQRNFARCRGLFDAGQIGYAMGNYREAQRYLEESLAIGREIGDKGRVAAALQPLGGAWIGLGDLRRARRYAEEALALARESGNKREVAAALSVLGQLSRVEGNLDVAQVLFDEGLALARELDDRESIAISLVNLAMLAIGRCDAERTRAMLREVHSIVAETGSRTAGQSVLEVSAGLGALQRAWERAAFFFGAAEAQAGRSGLHRDPADEAFLAPLVAKSRQALGVAAFAQAEAAGRARSYEDAMNEARAWVDEGT